MCFSTLAEDDTEWHLVCCGSLHAFAALFMFLFIDTTVLLFGASSYLDATPRDGLSILANAVSVSALGMLALFLPFGFLGVFKYDKRFMAIYLNRLRLAIGFSIVWMVVCFLWQDELDTAWDSLFWLLISIVYLIGASFCSRALEFLTDYKGYDGADPVVYQAVAEELFGLTPGGQQQPQQQPDQGAGTETPYSGQLEEVVIVE